ncbi:MAG: putative sulfate exporter family transporter [Bacillota bacterium]
MTPIRAAERQWWSSDDWCGVWLGALGMLLAVTRVITRVPQVAKWTSSPRSAFPPGVLLQVLVLGAGLALATALAMRVSGQRVFPYLRGFVALFGLAMLAFTLGNQASMRHYGLNDIIWALALGTIIANTVGRPDWLKPALKGELFIKTGLVLLGAEILLNRVLSLGIRGLGVAWLVTPVVIVFMYFLGTRALRIPSRSLVATVAATTSVCGVSAAIAVGAATRARREEISYAISVSLIFTVLMMIAMPVACRWLGLSEPVSGAWIGGTVDSTGAVVVSGALVGPVAMQVAAVVKMIQNMLIGLTAFVMATVWVTRVERTPGQPRASCLELWRRFPKFILGFLGASMVFSLVLVPALGENPVDQILKVTAGLRNWLFCLAFTSIGLESNVRELGQVAQSPRPLVLYVTGQLFNLVLTLGAAWLLFGGRFFRTLH